MEAARLIRQPCQDSVVQIAAHRLATCLSSVKAIYDDNSDRAHMLQRKYRLLNKVCIDGETRPSKGFIEVKNHAVELMQLDVTQRANELKLVQSQLPQHEIQRRKRVETALDIL